MKLDTTFALLISSMLALTACGTSTIGGGSGAGGGAGGDDPGGGAGNVGGPLCNGEPSPVSCEATGCPSGFVCVKDADPTTCHSSHCGCTAEGWQCTADCGMGGSSCLPEPASCNGEPSPESCEATGCPSGYACVKDDPSTCHPSGCLCGPDGWTCDKNCLINGSSCVADQPTPELCNGEPNPASCNLSGCPDGFECVVDPDPNNCHPIGCGCSPDGWVCDAACALSGSTCVPAQ